MAPEQREESRPVVSSGDHASGKSAEGSTLVPMLVAGLVLVVIGAIIVMAFV